MKKILLSLVAISLFTISAVSQNHWRFELNTGSGPTLGDFSNDDMNSEVNGFSEYGYFADLTARYYFSNWGVGIKAFSGGFNLDNSEYSKALATSLGAVDDNYYYTQTLGYFSFGTQVGVSYNFPLSEQLSLEPSFYFGFLNMIMPPDELIYHDGVSTRTFRTEIAPAFGTIYTPGLRLNWKFHKRVGVSFNTEYLFASMTTQEIVGLDYDYQSTQKVEYDKNLAPQAFQIGFGVFFVL